MTDLSKITGKSKSTIQRALTKHGCRFELHAGRGGQKKYFHVSTLPEEYKDAIYRHEAEQSAPPAQEDTAPPPVVKDELEIDLTSLKKWQREIMEARLVLYREFERLRDLHGTNKAVAKLLAMAKAGRLPEHIQRMVPRANARRGTHRTLSRSMVLGWHRAVKRHGIGGLAPKSMEKKNIPAWAPYWHDVYNVPQKPSIPEAMRELKRILPENIEMPSYHQLRRYHDKRSRLERQKGRHSPAALKRFRGYIRRSTDNLQPLDVVQCDGHSFKAKIAHPVHGRPFAPEVCAVIDVKTKMCLGWSSGLAESAHTVADALRHAMTVDDTKPWGGVPAILYTDKGAGNMAQMLSDEVTGILARAGITHHTGIPGNAQGRGLIEKTNQRLWISAARRLETFVGTGMDEQKKREIYLLMDREVRQTGTCVTRELPTWSRFLESCEQSMRDYNNTPHHGLPKMRDAQGRIRHMTPAEAWFTAIRNGWEPTLLDKDILADLFRPQATRKALRGQVSLHGNIYYDNILEHYHGEKVIVEYDIHDPGSVRVRDMHQRLICVAALDRNKRDFFPLSEAERAREKRYQGRKTLLERKLEEVEAERSGTRVIDMETDDQLVVQADPGAMERLAAGKEMDVDLIEVQVPDEKPAMPDEPARQPVRLFRTKSERFDAILAELKRAPRPLTREEYEFLNEYYEEDGGRLYMQLVGDLRAEYGVDDGRESAAQ